MTEPDNQAPARPWQWPAKWMRDEGFWQQVASSTMASLLAALFIYLGAIALGYIQGPSGRGVIALIAAGVLVPAAFLYGLIGMMNRRYDKQHERGETGLRGYRWYAAIPMALIFLVLLAVTSSVVLDIVKG